MRIGVLCFRSTRFSSNRYRTGKQNTAGLPVLAKPWQSRWPSGGRPEMFLADPVTANHLALVRSGQQGGMILRDPLLHACRYEFRR